MSNTTFLKDTFTAHSIYVQRYAGGQFKEALGLLSQLEKTIAKKLKDAKPDSANAAKLSVLYKNITTEIEKQYKVLGKKNLENMKEFAEYEAGFTHRAYNKAVNVDFNEINPAVIQAAVTTNTMEIGKEKVRLDTMYESLGSVKANDIVQRVKVGVVGGLSTQEIVRDIRLQMKSLHRKHVETLVRTTTNHISQLAKELTFKGNSKVLGDEEFVATLDSRTTTICASFDGKKFKKGKGPVPPLHHGCRSVRIRTVKEKYKAPVDGNRTARTEDGRITVDGRTTYQSFLRDRSRAFQEDMLGVTKARLFREGNLSLDKFVDKNYKPYTLEELRRKEPKAFDRAGLSE